MKVYIIADMEGAAGITCPEQCIPGHPRWEEARREITRDVNAAIRGAVSGGAGAVVVRDSHAYGFNLLVEELEPGVEYIGGQYEGPVPVFGDLRGAGLAFYLAGHAQASTAGAFSPHTLRHRFRHLRVGGKPLCEVELFGALLGAHGMKMGLVTGEQAAVDQATTALPWLLSVAVPKDPAVYERHGYLIQERIRDRIFRAALEAVQRGPEMPLFTYEGPVTLEAEFETEAEATRHNRWGFPREGPTLRITADRYEDAFIDLLKLGYFSPRTWPYRRFLLAAVRCYQGLKSGCWPR